MLIPMLCTPGNCLFCSFNFHTYVERDALCACSLWLKEDLWLVNLHLKVVEAKVI